MKKPEIWKLVLARLIPAKSDFSRDDWRTYINRYLLPEIQGETLRFYGENTSAEASHPGLDYADPAHRTRLQAFPRHSQLLRVFDDLRLTQCEIHVLCKWEGTRLAKEHFERQHKTKIKDTTWDDVQPYNKQTPTGYLVPGRLSQRGGGLAPAESEYQLPSNFDGAMEDEMTDASERVDEGEDSGEESEDELQQSYGVELNQRLMDGRMDADWEQWMKEAAERGDVPGSFDLSRTHALQPSARPTSQHTRVLTSSGSSSNGTNPQQSQMDPTTQVLNNDGTVAQYPRPLSPWMSHSFSSLHQVSQSRETSSSAFRSSAPQTPPLPSNVNVGPVLPVQVPQTPNSITRNQSTYWGREIPEIFSDRPRPHVAALQAQLPRPPPYRLFYPAARVVSAPAASPAPSATTSASVPS